MTASPKQQTLNQFPNLLSGNVWHRLNFTYSDSSANTATRLWVDDRGIGVRFAVKLNIALYPIASNPILEPIQNSWGSYAGE
jgi:hypothetical protein